jgi:hypothetical protein
MQTETIVRRDNMPVSRRSLLQITGAAVLSSALTAPTTAQGGDAWDKTFPKSDRVDHRKVGLQVRRCAVQAQVRAQVELQPGRQQVSDGRVSRVLPHGPRRIEVLRGPQLGIGGDPGRRRCGWATCRDRQPGR